MLGWFVVVLVLLANARAARVVGERWAIDTEVPLPRIGVIVLIDAAIVVAYAMLSGHWGVLGVLPLLATVLLVALRSGARSRRHRDGVRPPAA